MTNLWRLRLVAVLSVGLLGIGATAVYADNHEEDTDPTGDGAVDEASDTGVDGTGMGSAADGASNHDPLVMPKGKLGVRIGVQINLSSDSIAKPLSIVPDVRYGVMPKLDVGLYHSPMGITGFWGGVGDGLCVSGETNGCFNVYEELGLLGRYQVMEQPEAVELAVEGGLVFGSAFEAFDPLLLSLKAGARGRYSAGLVAVDFAPAIFVGVTERDLNKEALSIPVSVGYAVSPKLHVGAQTGIQGPFDGFGDFYQIPLAIGGMFSVDDKIGVAGSFSFPDLLGNNGTADLRALSVYVMWHN